MKPETSNFLNFSINQPLQSCSKKSFTRLSSLWRWCSSLALAGRDLVRPVLRNGPTAVLAHLSEGRYLVGDLFLCLVVLAFFFHQFFPESPNDRTWYYTNWFYLFYTLRLWFAFVFVSLAAFCFWPKHHLVSLILFVVSQGVGWAGVLHYSFFVYDYQSFHSFPDWSVMVAALSIALGFCVSSDYAIHRYNHWIRGNHMRFIGIGESTKMTVEEKGKLAEMLAKEYRKLEVRI